MASPDIRVRLTPDGVREVTEALRKVQAEATIAQRKTASGLGAVTNALRGIKSLLPAIGFTAAAVGIAAIGRRALDTADNVGKLGQRAGASAENVSVLAFAGREADTDLSQLQTGLVRLVASLGELRKGQGESVEGFRALGLSARDFDGLDTAQAFDLIARRLANVQDEGRRAELALEIFGRRGGAQLIPLLNKVATDGFDNLRAAAERSGLYFTSGLTNASEAVNDSMTRMNGRVLGLATQFLTGLLPAVEETMTQFEQEIDEKGVGAMQRFGAQTGKSFGTAAAYARLFFGYVSLALDGTGRGLAALAAAATLFFSGDFSGALFVLKERFKEVREENKKAAEALSKDWDRLVNATNREASPITLKVKTKVDGGRPSNFDDGLTKGAQSVQQQLLQITKDGGDEQLKALQDISKQRRDLAAGAAEAEYKLLEARLIGNRDQIQAGKLLTAAELDALQPRLRNTRDNAVAQLWIEEQKYAAFRKQIERQNGFTQRAEQLQEQLTKQTIERQKAIVTGYYQDLQKLQQDYVARYRTSTEAIIAIDKEIADNRKEGETLFRDLRIGTLTEVEQRAARIRLAEQKTEELRKAAGTGDLENARQLRSEITALAGDIARANAPGLNQNESLNIGERLFNEANLILEAALTQQKAIETQNADVAAQKIQQVGDQIRILQGAIEALTKQEIGLNVTVKDQQLQAVAAQIGDFLARTPFQIAVQPVITGASGSVPGFADGGLLPGSSPSPKADNLLFAGTAGEFMQPVRAVQHYGVGFMEAIRNLEIPRFADGGLLGGGGSSGGVPGQAQEHYINIGGQRVGPVFGDREMVQNLVKALKSER